MLKKKIKESKRVKEIASLLLMIKSLKAKIREMKLTKVKDDEIIIHYKDKHRLLRGGLVFMAYELDRMV